MNKKRDSFKDFLFLSAGFHIVIFVVLTVKILIFPTEIPEHKSAVRIDVVALPEKNPTPKPAPQPVKKQPTPVAKKQPPKPKAPKKKPKKKKKIVKKKKPSLKKVKEEQSSALARLKALQKINKSKNEKENQFKGNNLSKGNSLTGLEKLHHESYQGELETHIRSHWNLPEWLANGNFKATVLIKINRNGGILAKLFVLKSGNELFDHQVKTTLEKANPLPAPPNNLASYYANKGIKVNFPE